MHTENAHSVRPSLKAEASKEEQRAVVRFLVAEVLRRGIKLKRLGMLSHGITLLHSIARPLTAILVRDKLQRFGWETLQHPPYTQIFPLVTPTFLAI